MLCPRTYAPRQPSPLDPPLPTAPLAGTLARAPLPPARLSEKSRKAPLPSAGLPAPSGKPRSVQRPSPDPPRPSRSLPLASRNPPGKPRSPPLRSPNPPGLPRSLQRRFWDSRSHPAVPTRASSRAMHLSRGQASKPCPARAAPISPSPTHRCGSQRRRFLRSLSAMRAILRLQPCLGASPACVHGPSTMTNSMLRSPLASPSHSQPALRSTCRPRSTAKHRQRRKLHRRTIVMILRLTPSARSRRSAICFILIHLSP